MKLIATKPFRNNTDPKIEIKDALHPDHIHKGAIFSIGVDKAGKDIPEFDDLSKADQIIVGLLKCADCIGDATDVKLVAKINAEIAEEKAAMENTKKLMEKQSGTDLLAQLISGQKGGK